MFSNTDIITDVSITDTKNIKYRQKMLTVSIFDPY